MDVEALHKCFLGTVQADQTVRQEAELQLQQAEGVVGFLGACLDILNADGVNPVVKKACCIYFKNKVLKNWGNPRGNLDEDEKPVIRDRIIPTIVKLDRTLRNQFIPVLNVMISYDFPSAWPNYIQSTISLFQNTNDMQSLYTGILCFSELTRHYRWKTNEDRARELDPIIEQYFPSLLVIGKQIVSNVGSYESSHEAGEVVKLIIKAYKFVTYHDLPEPLQQQQSFVEWGSFHVDVINMPLPAKLLEIDEEDRSLSPWVKSQKWAFANLYRLFERYGSKSLSKRFDYDAFRETFVNHVVPGLLNVYFKKIELWRQGKDWLSDACLYHLISFLEQCVVQKSCFQLIKPHVVELISEVAFPLLCPTDSVLDMFENDPAEYIHMILDIYEETNSPQMAVLSLIFTLVEKRTKLTLEPILQFAYEKLSSFDGVPETLEVAKQKESAFRIIGSISYKLTAKGSPVKDQMEAFVAAYILPCFRSQHAFLRARTCEVSSKFDKLEFSQEQNLNTLFTGVLSCFNETDNLPVQLEGALAIQAFMSFDQFKEALGSIIVETMEKLLELSNKVDSDTISAVIQECVESYSEQLQPFGANLMAKLSEQLLRLLTEINEASNGGPDDFDSDDLTDKHTAALGVFNTVVTVLLYFESSHEVIAQLEESYAPVLQYTLVNNMDDFYAEVAELIENTTFLTRSVSSTMWKLFESLITALMNNDLLLYLGDVVPSLKNYMVYGGATLRSNKQYQEALFQLITKLFTMDPEEEDVGANDIVNAADLAANFILCLDRDTAAPYIPVLIQHALRLFAGQDAAHASKKYPISLINMIVAALVINPNGCMQTLHEVQAVESFVVQWFGLVPSMRKVFDLKLSVLGVLSVLNIDLAALEELGLVSGLSQCGSTLAKLLGELPGAIKEMEKRREEFQAEDRFDESLLYGADEWEDEDEVAEGGDGNNDAADEYLQFLEQEGNLLSKENSKSIFNHFGDGDDDDFDDDPYSNTSLDNINVFKAFKDCFVAIQANDAGKYGSIVSQLTAAEQSVLSNIASIASD